MLTEISFVFKRPKICDSNTTLSFVVFRPFYVAYSRLNFCRYGMQLVLRPLNVYKVHVPNDIFAGPFLRFPNLLIIISFVLFSVRLSTVALTLWSFIIAQAQCPRFVVGLE